MALVPHTQSEFHHQEDVLGNVSWIMKNFNSATHDPRILSYSVEASSLVQHGKSDVKRGLLHYTLSGCFKKSAKVQVWHLLTMLMERRGGERRCSCQSFRVSEMPVLCKSRQ